MALEAEEIVDRRRLRRKLAFWRFAGFAALAIIIAGVLVWTVGRDAALGFGTKHIARVSVSGFIGDMDEKAKVLERIAEADNVAGVIIAIDSTGGATTGGETLYLALRDLAAEKPIVATIDTFGASAAYMAAIATDHIVARRTSITGSIGVIFQMPEVSALLDKIGVEVEVIKSGPLKAEPSPFKPATEEAREMIAGVVADSFNWFVDIVAERRGLSRGEILRLADGRIFTGHQAMNAGLVDRIGGEEEAIEWLERERALEEDLPVRDWGEESDGNPLSIARALLVWIAGEIGLAPRGLGDALIDGILPDRLMLDGLLSVWHPPLGQNDGEGAFK